MRILAIRLRNLNSLAGTWSIDFTAPEFAATGIFAITGPTGAGKSTILDAICLALFARTPRLGHISKGSNEIMARRTGECFAEVEFETGQGRFRCHWGQHRARRSAAGELQPPRHEMVDTRTDKVLETRTKEVGRLVEQVTGMDYDRFTRSILLAQGDFAAFLEADADQRAPILEQITGTGIYSRISVAVHERTGAERHQTSLLQEAMGRIELLDADRERELTVAIVQGETEAAALGERLARLQQALHRLAAVATLTAQLTETDRLLGELAHRRDAAADELARLERGRRAQALQPEHSQWCRTGERIKELRALEATNTAQLERLRGERHHIAAEHGQADLALRETLARQQREAETIAAVRVLDLRLHERKQNLAQRHDAFRRAGRERDETLQKRHNLKRQLAGLATEQERLAAFLRDHGCDSLLVEELAGFRRQLQQLAAWENDLPVLGKTLRDMQSGHTDRLHRWQQVEQARQEAERSLTVLRQGQQDKLTQRETLLAGQDLSSWRRQGEEAAEQCRHLEQAADLLARQRQLAAELTELENGHRRMQAQEQQHQTDLRILEERQALREQLLRQCEENYRQSLRIRSLEEQRQQLRAGSPCPLCGATHHPWVDGQPPMDASVESMTRARTDLDEARAATALVREKQAGLARDIEHNRQALARGQRQHDEGAAQLAPMLARLGAADAITEQRERSAVQAEELRRRVLALDRLETDLAAASAHTELAMAHLHDLHQQELVARHEIGAIETEIRRLEARIGAAQQDIDAGRDELVRQLHPLGIDACPPGQADNLLHHLDSRLDTWKKQQERAAQLNAAQDRMRAELGSLDLLLATLDTNLSQQATELADLQGEVEGLRRLRQERFGDRDPDVEEQRLGAEVRQAEERTGAVRARLVEADKQVHGLEQQARLHAEELAALLPRYREQETDLGARARQTGFADLDDFQAALLPAMTLAELDAHRQALDREQTALTARRAEQQAALRREQEACPENRSRDELLAEQTGLGQALTELQQRIGADRERLAVNDRHRREFESHRQVLAAQQRELERWELLHLLIGSADGKKFRVFAQGLTFEVMISHANRQLRRMSDRYLLLRDPKEPLALQVLDNYQAGEIRSTRNLSGGESFLVSLALALGLSAMASHNVRVDSLFLDEGFGTLDEESLETALQTLAELRQDGKLIGIISHVPILRERIDLRIQVQPGPDGTSRLLGPGCTRLT